MTPEQKQYEFAKLAGVPLAVIGASGASITKLNPNWCEGCSPDNCPGCEGYNKTGLKPDEYSRLIVAAITSAEKDKQ